MRRDHAVTLISPNLFNEPANYRIIRIPSVRDDRRADGDAPSDNARRGFCARAALVRRDVFALVAMPRARTYRLDYCFSITIISAVTPSSSLRLSASRSLSLASPRWRVTESFLRFPRSYELTCTRDYEATHRPDAPSNRDGLPTYFHAARVRS